MQSYWPENSDKVNRLHLHYQHQPGSECLPRSLTNSFSEISANIAISHILLKTRFFGLHFCRKIRGYF